MGHAFDDEKPEHLVKITQSFYISIHPITQAIWKTIMDGYNPAFFKGDDRPVENVSWIDIVKGREIRKEIAVKEAKLFDSLVS